MSSKKAAAAENVVENQECTLRTFITGAEKGKAGSLKADIMDGRRNENGGIFRLCRVIWNSF